jgi:hypothetical protein
VKLKCFPRTWVGAADSGAALAIKLNDSAGHLMPLSGSFSHDASNVLLFIADSRRRRDGFVNGLRPSTEDRSNEKPTRGAAGLIPSAPQK